MRRRRRIVISNMAGLLRPFFNVNKKLIFPAFTRSITLSPINHIKEIIEKKDGKTLTIEAKIIPDSKDVPYLDKAGNGACPLCSLGFPVNHTDVLILSQFMRRDGCLLPKRVTGVCTTQQRRLESLVAMAQKAGLMSNLTPSYSRKDPKKRYRWKKYNTYFDEDTIKARYRHVTYLE